MIEIRKGLIFFSGGMLGLLGASMKRVNTEVKSGAKLLMRCYSCCDEIYQTYIYLHLLFLRGIEV